MNNKRYLLQTDCVRAKRGGHSKPKLRGRNALDAEDLPQRESMRRPHLHNRKNDNGKLYTVLKQFLRSRIGRQWDAVYSELCQKLRREHALDAYAREWVEGWVLQNVRIDKDGEVREQPHDCRLYNDFYVHPENGTLQFCGRPKREKHEHKPLVETKKVGDVVRYAKQRGIWYEVTLAPIPTVAEVRAGLPAYIGTSDVVNPAWQRPRGPVDVIIGERAVAQTSADLQEETYWKTASKLRVFRAVWGGFVYAARKRQLNGDELAREGLRNDPMA
jgi:hypothetical protein